MRNNPIKQTLAAGGVAYGTMAFEFFTPNLAAYNQAFTQGNPSLAAAMAVIVALLAFAFSALFLRIVNRKGNRAW